MHHEWIEETNSFTLNTRLHIMLCEYLGVDDLLLSFFLVGGMLQEGAPPPTVVVA